MQNYYGLAIGNNKTLNYLTWKKSIGGGMLYHCTSLVNEELHH